MVAFDNTILSLLLFPDAELQEGPDGLKVEHARERVLGLIESLEAGREQVAIPSPALAEVLVTEGADVQDILTTLRGSAFIRIESFDERAAVELAMRLREARKAGDQRESQPITKPRPSESAGIVARFDPRESPCNPRKPSRNSVHPQALEYSPTAAASGRGSESASLLVPFTRFEATFATAPPARPGETEPSLTTRSQTDA